jgi:ribosomal protein S1
MYYYTYRWSPDTLLFPIKCLHDFQDTIPFSLKITSSNTGGLIGTLMGLEVFVPNSHICKRDGMNLEQVKAPDNVAGSWLAVMHSH